LPSVKLPEGEGAVKCSNCLSLRTWISRARSAAVPEVRDDSVGQARALLAPRPPTTSQTQTGTKISLDIEKHGLLSALQKRAEHVPLIRFTGYERGLVSGVFDGVVVRSGCALHLFDDHRYALSHPDAHGGEPEPDAFAALQLVQERGQNAGAGASERMSEGNSPAVGV
jgi:hypothetical protein